MKPRVNVENLTKLLRLLNRVADMGELARDEHTRYSLYIDALAAASSQQEDVVLDIVRADPDRAMSQAAIVEHINRVATHLNSASEFGVWVDSHRKLLEYFDFAIRRAEEWRLLKKVTEGDDDVSPLVQASDWLQRKIAEESDSQAALSLIASSGRTKRVRGTATRRLSHTTRPEASH